MKIKAKSKQITKRFKLAPFRIDAIKGRKGRFSFRFSALTRGELTAKEGVINVQLDFPQWWAAELQRKLRAM